MHTHFRSLFFVGAMVVISQLSGCAALDAGKDFASGAFYSMLGGKDNSQPPAKLIEYQPELEITELWNAQVGSGTNGQKLELGIAISYGKLFVADSDGLIQARDAATGDLVWEQETDYAFSAGPGVGNETLVMGGSRANVAAFNIENGEKIWTANVSSEVLAVPVIANNIVIIRTIDGKVFALDEKNGKQLWVFERDVPALSIRGLSRPVIVEGSAVVGFANGKLAALRLTDGKLMWEATVAIPSGRSEVDRLVDLDADPVESDGVIFVSSYQAGTAGVLEVDGDILWRNENVSSASGMSVDWRYLYITDTQSQVWQLDQRNGASLWKQDELLNRQLTAPRVYQDYVVVGDFEGYVHWLSYSDGRQMARTKLTGSAIETQPVVVDKTVYVYAKDGTLAAFQVTEK